MLTPVDVGQNLWIGMNEVMTLGVTIGEGAIIGMGTAVSRDVPPLAILDVDYRARRDKLMPTVNVVMAGRARTIEAQPAHSRSHAATSRKHPDTGAMRNA